MVPGPGLARPGPTQTRIAQEKCAVGGFKKPSRVSTCGKFERKGAITKSALLRNCLFSVIMEMNRPEVKMSAGGGHAGALSPAHKKNFFDMIFFASACSEKIVLSQVHSRRLARAIYVHFMSCKSSNHAATNTSAHLMCDKKTE
jgi:hypothetical protein